MAQSGPPSVATQLVMMARSQYDLRISTTGVPFAVPRSKPRIVRALRGRMSLRAELAKQWFTSQNRSASGEALTEAITTLEGFAQETEPVELSTRVARFGTELWLDLANDKGEAVCISRFGWHITDDVPVLFRRTTLTNPLPRPVVGAGHLELFSLFNYVPVSGADWSLVIGDLIAALDPDIPHPVVSVNGEQGTGKTTATSMLVALIDPTGALTRKAPRDAEEWIVAASGSWRVAIDNIGRAGIPDWLSDSLCRAATGTGDVKRALYTDDDVHVISFRRSCLINGITLGRMSEDLADRALPIHLVTIDPEDRKDDREVWAAFDAAHPRLLGALLDFAVLALDRLATGSDELAHRPRMIDFARYVDAVDRIMGTSGLERYVDTKDQLAAEARDSDPFIEALEGWIVAMHGGSISMRASEILDGVESRQKLPVHNLMERWTPPPGWPKTIQGVGQKLTYMAPALRKAGWIVRDDVDAHSKSKIWTIVISGKNG